VNQPERNSQVSRSEAAEKQAWKPAAGQAAVQGGTYPLICPVTDLEIHHAN
jgi:hypothetical protein